MSSCSSGGQLLPFKKDCRYINISSSIKDTIKGRGDKQRFILKDNSIVYGVPKKANLKCLPVCYYRGRYFYIKQ